MCNGLLDASTTFKPREMLRTYARARGVFRRAGCPGNIQYQLLNTPHGYFPETRMVMLGWFDQELKNTGDGSPRPAPSISLSDPAELAVFKPSARSPKIVTTCSFEKDMITRLYDSFLTTKVVDPSQKISGLRKLLGLPENPDTLKKAYPGPMENGWITGLLESRQGHLLHYAYLPPSNPKGDVLILCPPDSATGGEHQAYINRYIDRYFNGIISSQQKKGNGLLIATLWDLGRQGSEMGREVNRLLPLFHTEARAELWMGRTIEGEWVGDLNVITAWVRKMAPESGLQLGAGKELCLAALASAALYPQRYRQLHLVQMPLDYTLENATEANYFNLAIHLPGFLNWGGPAMLAALARGPGIKIYQPVTLGGRSLAPKQKQVFQKLHQHLLTLLQADNHLFFHP